MRKRDLKHTNRMPLSHEHANDKLQPIGGGSCQVSKASNWCAHQLGFQVSTKCSTQHSESYREWLVHSSSAQRVR